MIFISATTKNLKLDQVSNSNSLTFTIFWNQNIKISLHVYGLEKRFKCEMKIQKRYNLTIEFQIKLYVNKYKYLFENEKFV